MYSGNEIRNYKWDPVLTILFDNLRHLPARTKVTISV